MAKKSLSVVASSRFREALSEIMRERDLSLQQTATILGCCRKTVWNLLRAETTSSARLCYSHRLAKYLGYDGKPPWDASGGCDYGVRDILKEWKAASTPSLRRKAAYRLSVYANEMAVETFGLATATELLVSEAKEPARVRLFLLRGNAAPSSICLFFDASKRERIAIKFVTSQGHERYSGELLPPTLASLLTFSKKQHGNKKNSNA